MSLHRVDQSQNGARLMAAATYASELATRTLPKHRLPKHRPPDTGVSANVAYAIVRDEIMLDGNSRQNLATFCTTWVSPEVRQLMPDCVDKNMIDCHSERTRLSSWAQRRIFIFPIERSVPGR